MLRILLEEEVAEEEEQEGISEEGGRDKIKLKKFIFIAYTIVNIGMMHLHVSFLGIKLNIKEIKKKIKLMTKKKLKHLNPFIML